MGFRIYWQYPFADCFFYFSYQFYLFIYFCLLKSFTFLPSVDFCLMNLKHRSRMTVIWVPEKKKTLNTPVVCITKWMVISLLHHHHRHHHHVVPLAWISLTLSRHFSLSFIASGRSSGLHPVSSHSCCMYVLAGRPAFARAYVGVHRSTSLMSSSLLLQQCPACLVCLTCIVFVMRGRWPYSWCFVGCCRQDLFNLFAYPIRIIPDKFKIHSIIQFNELFIWILSFNILGRYDKVNPIAIKTWEL